MQTATKSKPVKSTKPSTKTVRSASSRHDHPTVRSASSRPVPEIDYVAMAARLNTYSAEMTAECQAIETARQAYEKCTRYHRITIGLFLLKARDQYLVPNDGSRNNHGKGGSCAALHMHQIPESFEHYLDTINWLPRRNAYAYIKAARNVGLTEESTREDIDRLRTNKTLDGLSAAEWSALCGSGKAEEDDTDPNPQQTKFSFYDDTLTTLNAQRRTAVEIRSTLDSRRYATVAAAMLRAYEEFTGLCVVPDPHQPDYDPNHWKTQWPDADHSACS